MPIPSHLRQSGSITNRDVVSFCPIYSGGCGVVLAIDENDRILGVKGDKVSPLTRGLMAGAIRQRETLRSSRWIQQ